MADLHLPVIPWTDAEAERILKIITPTTNFNKAEQLEGNSTGSATVRVIDSSDAFSSPSANISFENQLDFKVGNGLFKKLWVSALSSTLASDGLGRLFNARCCQRCHFKDGRGHPPDGPDDSATSMLIRISIRGGVAPQDIVDYTTNQPRPNHGGQIQDASVGASRPRPKSRSHTRKRQSHCQVVKQRHCAVRTTH
ncbi:di-heme oxidoredictase family protein [uncultured Tateyamaria sp.]|uniref:di-heme oxidoredictase family protein n=1 Tax=uncultured Tateyamaria sp. TaxID=455651 RepID=UPI00260D2736|nr:di-heme oxidoredictase family protein [uncultured Tateyamaria sp.]